MAALNACALTRTQGPPRDTAGPAARWTPRYNGSAQSPPRGLAHGGGGFHDFCTWTFDQCEGAEGHEQDQMYLDLQVAKIENQPVGAGGRRRRAP